MKENHNKSFFYEALPNLIKERKTHLEGKRKEQQERTNIKPRNNNQKHKHTNKGHKKKNMDMSNGVKLKS
jgi:hypothetical protein